MLHIGYMLLICPMLTYYILTCCPMYTCFYIACLYIACLYIACLYIACLYTTCLYTTCLYTACLYTACLYTACFYTESGSSLPGSFPSPVVAGTSFVPAQLPEFTFVLPPPVSPGRVCEEAQGRPFIVLRP